MKTITTTYNPETHKLVPKDLADDTIDAACDAGGLYRVEFVRAWDAALDAAPEAPEQADHWQQYAKPGETAQQCIERHRAEQDALMTLLAQARSEPNAKAEGKEAVAFLVEGWHEGKLIAKTLEHTADEARGTAAVFAGHYPFIHTRPLYTTPPRREWECKHCGEKNVD